MQGAVHACCPVLDPALVFAAMLASPASQTCGSAPLNASACWFGPNGAALHALCVVHCTQVADWLDFVTGRSSAPHNQMRRERLPPERKNNKGNGRKKAGAGAGSDRQGVGYEELLQQGTGNRVSRF